MKFIKMFLFNDGAMPVDPFTGHQTKPSGKTIDTWIYTSSPRDYFKGSKPPRNIVNSERINPGAYAAQGDVIRVNVFDAG